MKNNPKGPSEGPYVHRNRSPEGRLGHAPRRLPHAQTCAKLRLQQSLLQPKGSGRAATAGPGGEQQLRKALHGTSRDLRGPRAPLHACGHAAVCRHLPPLRCRGREHHSCFSRCPATRAAGKAAGSCENGIVAVFSSDDGR